jgi:hypothetical protein
MINNLLINDIYTLISKNIFWVIFILFILFFNNVNESSKKDKSKNIVMLLFIQLKNKLIESFKFKII